MHLFLNTFVSVSFCRLSACISDGLYLTIPIRRFLSDDPIRKRLSDDPFMIVSPPVALSEKDFYPKDVSFPPGNEKLRASDHFSNVHFFREQQVCFLLQTVVLFALTLAAFFVREF